MQTPTEILSAEGPLATKISGFAVRPQQQEMAEAILQKTKTNVEKIRSRGGKVVFVRFPSTGGLRQLENKITPRAAYWDRVLETTGAPGIHFEDYPELKGFDCPEWSHLTKKDATKFTSLLVPLFQKLRAEGKM